MKKNFIYLFGAITLLIQLSSCEEKTVCDLATDAPLRANFYSILNDTLEVDTITGGISVIGIGATDSLVKGLTSQGSVQFTLNPYKDETAYLIKFDNTLDTLVITYERELQLVSEQCGFVTVFDVKGLAATYNYIDSIALINNRVTTETEQHVKIFF